MSTHPLHDYIAGRIAEKVREHHVVVIYDHPEELRGFFAEAANEVDTKGRIAPLMLGEGSAQLFEVDGSFLAARAAEPVEPTNIVQALEARLASGEIKLSYSPDGHGYLASVLAALKVSQESQVLPFTSSSLQFDRITPKTPRALYFNDDVAVGAVHPGGLIEIIANDRRGGIVFYTMDNNPGAAPRVLSLTRFC